MWDRAKERHDSYRNIFTAAMRNMSRLKTPSVVAKLEAASLKAIVDFEVRRNKNNPAWTFREQGISRLVEDFFLLDEYITGFESERFRNWSTSWYRHLLSQQSIDEIETIADEKLRTDAVVKKVSPLITPVLAFFGALCHALQEGENQLSATDAYWLGLIDEVIGDNTLMSLRMIEEYRPDESEKKQEEDADKQTGVSAGA